MTQATNNNSGKDYYYYAFKTKSGVEHNDVEYKDGDEICERCGGEKSWCNTCECWTSTCCEDYGTCDCS